MTETFQQAVTLLQQGQHADAEKLLRIILQKNPKDAEALHVLGIVAHVTHRPQRAVDLIGKSIKIDPKSALAYGNLGNALTDLQRHDEALAAYDKALALQPESPELHLNKGRILNAFGRYDDALTCYSDALALQPDLAEAYSNSGITLIALKRYTEALTSCDKAIALRPRMTEAFVNRGNALNALKRYEEALASFDKALALKPDFAEAYCNRGDALYELGRFRVALATFDKALSLQPNFAEAHFGKSLTLLLLGRYDTGLKEYEWRTKRSGAPSQRFNSPLWTGKQPLRGKTLLIHPELQLGDMLHFCRYAKMAEAQGAKVVLSAQPVLRRLLSTLSPTIEHQTPKRYDYHIPVMSLPFAFATTLATIPADIPYIRAEPDKVEQWAARIGTHGVRIGICWQGSVVAVEADRSFALEKLQTIAKIPNIRLISLQKDASSEQLADLPQVEAFGDELDAGPDAFIDTAAIMENVDLVITPDTAIAHLAGALGRPTWVALKKIPEWRWGLESDTTPWYPTMRLFRQQSSGDWDSVFAKMAAALAQ